MDTSQYSPGLHQLLTLRVSVSEKLTESHKFIEFTQQLLTRFDLEQVGLAVHDFENRSFTLAFCLKESHICIHTWPEFMQLTLDVYLCNYMQDNSEKVKAISEAFIGYFEADIITNFQINR
ncbi:adenosylmethionine decarboxylase [Flavobacterium magnum]|uniref:Adenosylmethionine decarboxylase n=1 Tax=Flavobacterium magnum TaxID=2162713 RepID=A0A2S0RBM4_9FLAO|nr:S-adenosylmethionine decarboxylase [Flavobacterium magnum]AWA28954.1 adenosylmethionine decarboxylase [Flavobacterium magnum]